MTTRRPRRLRRTESLRQLVANVHIHPSDLMLPIFVKEGLTEPQEITGLPGVLQHTEESFLSVLDAARDAGIVSVMFFAVPLDRDETGSQACRSDGILSRVIRRARAHVGEEMVVVADLCLDEFTSHGHCGVLDDRGEVDNDATLTHYVSMATVLAQAGADLLGTSGMMDGQVGAVRTGLDQAGFSSVGILAYGAKYASNFYGPFRNAVDSQLVGDRKTYQQDFRRSGEGIDEVLLDCEQGADIVMVKPALLYLDVLSQVSQRTTIPVAAYIISGEYSMVEIAAAAGVVDRESTILEILTAVKRAGADIICTYWALEFAEKLGK